jgi:hypothetical protein
MRNAACLLTLLSLLMLTSCLPSSGTVNSIVGVWTEEEVTSETNHRFETYHDFWGNWTIKGKTLELKITGGNQLPAQPSYAPEYELHTKQLILNGQSPAGDTSITKITYKYSGPPPPNGILP